MVVQYDIQRLNFLQILNPKVNQHPPVQLSGNMKDGWMVSGQGNRSLLVSSFLANQGGYLIYYCFKT